MATGSVNELTTRIKEYFDQLAPDWDKKVEVSREKLQCLGNVIEELDIRPGSCVLDIGSGTGILLPFLFTELGDTGRIIALDISSEMLYQAKAKIFQPSVCFTQADVNAIPLADNSVDFVICNSAFPHFSDKLKALQEISRVLKNNGKLAICHTMSREMINQLHKSIGGVVANDLLPDEPRLRELLKQSTFEITHFVDSSKQYLVIAEKRHPGISNSSPKKN